MKTEMATAQGFTLFETAIGTAGIAWSDRGLVGVQLPDADRSRARAGLRRRFPGAREVPPAGTAAAAVTGISRLLCGEPTDLSTIPLDQDGVPEFDRQVYSIARTIPAGETLSYGQVAARLGDARLAREVGQALGRNPFAIVVPCHRVVAAGGKPGGFSARGGVATKQRLLAIEGAHVAWQLPLEPAFTDAGRL